MAKKDKSMQLFPSEEEVEYYRKELTDLYKLRLGTDDVSEQVENILKTSIDGFTNAPKTLKARVYSIAKIGQKHEKHRKAKESTKPKNYTKLALDSRVKKLQEFIDLYDGFAKHLIDEDKQYVNKRLEFYIKEFEFNQSSDLPLLLQLITEELLQRRLMIFLATNMNDESGAIIIADASKAIKNLSDDMSNLQVKLGITRQQRETATGAKEGSISEIVVQLEKKKKKIAEVEKIEREQEQIWEEMKKKRGDYNPVPDSKEETERIISGYSGIKI
jgi:hypothetical protein